VAHYCSASPSCGSRQGHPEIRADFMPWVTRGGQTSNSAGARDRGGEKCRHSGYRIVVQRISYSFNNYYVLRRCAGSVRVAANNRAVVWHSSQSASHVQKGICREQRTVRSRGIFRLRHAEGGYGVTNTQIGSRGPRHGFTKPSNSLTDSGEETHLHSGGIYLFLMTTVSLLAHWVKPPCKGNYASCTFLLGNLLYLVTAGDLRVGAKSHLFGHKNDRSDQGQSSLHGGGKEDGAVAYR